MPGLNRQSSLLRSTKPKFYHLFFGIFPQFFFNLQLYFLTSPVHLHLHHELGRKSEKYATLIKTKPSQVHKILGPISVRLITRQSFPFCTFNIIKVLLTDVHASDIESHYPFCQHCCKILPHQ